MLLATKLAPPTRRGLLHRRRLVQALDGASRHRLALLVAPAGWGKTSLLADWHTTGRRERVGRLALDPEDSDPVRSWTYLTTTTSCRIRNCIVQWPICWPTNPGGCI